MLYLKIGQIYLERKVFPQTASHFPEDLEVTKRSIKAYFTTQMER
jgi:hypothetical protein